MDGVAYSKILLGHLGDDMIYTGWSIPTFQEFPPMFAFTSCHGFWVEFQFFDVEHIKRQVVSWASDAFHTIFWDLFCWGDISQMFGRGRTARIFLLLHQKTLETFFFPVKLALKSWQGPQSLEWKVYKYVHIVIIYVYIYISLLFVIYSLQSPSMFFCGLQTLTVQWVYLFIFFIYTYWDAPPPRMPVARMTWNVSRLGDLIPRCHYIVFQACLCFVGSKLSIKIHFGSHPPLSIHHYQEDIQLYIFRKTLNLYWRVYKSTIINLCLFFVGDFIRILPWGSSPLNHHLF